MIRTLARVVGWLASGGALLGGCYWLFLNTPESNALMLTASAVLILLMIATAAITINGALLLAAGTNVRSALRRAIAGIPWFVIAAVPLVLVWIVALRADSWIAEHNGEISAWFIARFGWSNIDALFTTQTWLSRWIRWVAAPLACFCLLAAMLEGGVRAVAPAAWIRRAWHWRTLALATLVFFVLFAGPWRLTMWRPDLSPTWMEPVVVGLRLATVALLGLIGSALLISLAVRKSD